MKGRPVLPVISRLTLTLVMILGSLLVGSGPARAADGCSYANPMTVFTVYLDLYEHVELRANANQVCAWGRLTQGSSYDLVWVDRSVDGGRTWQQLGITAVPYRSGSAYTPAYNDVNLVMRACAAYGDGLGTYWNVKCTGWW